VRYILLDDASDTATAVRHARRLIEDRVDVILGPSLTPNSLALLDVIAEAETPMISLAGSAAIIEPVDARRRWAFKTPQSDAQMATAVIGHMTRLGVRSVGFIGFNDAYGEGWWRELSRLAEARGIRLVASERYQRTDTSVTGQILRLMSSNPDAIVVGGSGTGAALPHVTLIERGYRKGIYHNHGTVNAEFIKVGGKGVEGAVAPTGPLVVPEELPAEYPTRKVSLDFTQRYEKAFGAGTRNAFAGYTYDAFLLLDAAAPAALKKAKPGTPEFREALRAALENVRNVAGTHGIYNMNPKDHNGLDERARVLVQVRQGAWHLMK
jgi:branched-chain amino acid transport system substrate-binding protein